MGAVIAGEALRLEGAVSMEEAAEVRSPRLKELVLLDGLQLVEGRRGSTIARGEIGRDSGDTGHFKTGTTFSEWRWT